MRGPAACLRGAPASRGCPLDSELRFARVLDGHDGMEASTLASALHALVAEKLRRGNGGTGAACGEDGELLDAPVVRALHDAVLALDAGLSAAVGATWQSIIASSCVGRAPSMSAGEPTDQDGVRYRRRIRATLELGVFPPDSGVAPPLP